MMRAKQLPVLIVRKGKAYEPTTCILGDHADSATPLARAVGLMGDWDLLVRLKIEGKTVAFDLVKSNGSGAYRVVRDLNTGKGSRYPPNTASAGYSTCFRTALTTMGIPVWWRRDGRASSSRSRTSPLDGWDRSSLPASGPSSC